MIPGPRPPKGHDVPLAGRSRGPQVHRSLRPVAPPEAVVVEPGTDESTTEQAGPAPVVLTRTTRGWSVTSPGGDHHAADLVEGLCLADLVAEEFGPLIEPDRSARRSARGAVDVPADGDPVDARVAALERTVAQLEHALAARVATERAIGVLAERHATSPRAAFESLRGQARSSGRTVAELAHEVLDGLPQNAPPAADAPSPGAVAAAPSPPAAPPAPRSGPAVVTAAECRP